MSRSIILLLSITIGVQTIPAPEFTPCKKDDIVCLTKNTNKLFKLVVPGDPELGTERLDPMYQDKIVGDLGILKYQLFNSTVEGFGDCEFTNAKYDLENLKSNFNVFCPSFNMYGQYKTSGQFLSLNVEGEGDYSLKLKEFYNTVDSDLKITLGKDGNRYVSFKNFKGTGDLKGGMIVDATNLFNGQKDLAENFLKIVNQNWVPAAKILQEPVIKANLRKLMTNCNKYMKKIPINNMFLEV